MNFIDWTQVATTVIIVGVTLLTYLWSKADISGLKDKTSVISNLLSQVIGYLQEDGKFQPAVNLSQDSETVQATSPLSLTLKGKEIANKLNAEELVKKYYKCLLIPDDANKFHIQNTCIQFANHQLLQLVNSKEKNQIEELTYDAGGDMREITIIFGILFRDEYFRERGIDIPVPHSEGTQTA